jgi:hypothetical protein
MFTLVESGGAAMTLTAIEMQRRGGRATVLRNGRAHMAAIGRLGAASRWHGKPSKPQPEAVTAGTHAFGDALRAVAAAVTLELTRGLDGSLTIRIPAATAGPEGKQAG